MTCATHSTHAPDLPRLLLEVPRRRLCLRRARKRDGRLRPRVQRPAGRRLGRRWRRGRGGAVRGAGGVGVLAARAVAPDARDGGGPVHHQLHAVDDPHARLEALAEHLRERRLGRPALWLGDCVRWVSMRGECIAGGRSLAHTHEAYVHEQLYRHAPVALLRPPIPGPGRPRPPAPPVPEAPEAEAVADVVARLSMMVDMGM